jgi:hypothetical protein
VVGRRAEARPGSRFAGYFDIDFDRDPDGKLVLPTLGAPLDEVVAKGELELKAAGRTASWRCSTTTPPSRWRPGSAEGCGPGRHDADDCAGCWTRSITASPSGARASAQLPPLLRHRHARGRAGRAADVFEAATR